LGFPHRIINDPADHVLWPSEVFDLEGLYPHHKVFGNRSTTELQAELEAALGTINILKNQVDVLSSRLNGIPGYRLAVRLGKALRGKR
jgi:hypothetical protein